MFYGFYVRAFYGFASVWVFMRSLRGACACALFYACFTGFMCFMAGFMCSPMSVLCVFYECLNPRFMSVLYSAFFLSIYLFALFVIFFVLFLFLYKNKNKNKKKKKNYNEQRNR
jgi:uncharacterized membrane protein